MATNPANNSRNALMERERRANVRIISEFGKIQKRLAGELSDVLKRIDTARATTPNVPISLLIQAARLRKLLDDLSDEMFAVAKKLGMQTADAQAAAIRIAKKQAMDTAEISGDLTFFDSDATKELIGITGEGQPLARHFLKLAPVVRSSMFDALFFGIAAGQSNQQIAKAIREAIGGTSAAAMTIARTETNRAYREASRMFYSEVPSVIGWRWVAALDLNTCPICWSMHGRIFKTKTKLGTHPNCRCTMVPVFKGDAKVPTGPELFAKLNDYQKRAILGPLKFRLYNEGYALPDFVATYKNTFGTGRRIKNLKEITAAKVTKPEPPPAAPTIAKPTPTRADNAKPGVAAGGNKPGQPIPEFKNAKAAAAILEQRFPGTKFDFTDISLDDNLLAGYMAETDRLFVDFPEVAEGVKYIGTFRDKTKRPFSQRWDKGTNGVHYHRPGVDRSDIGLNPLTHKDAAAWIRQKESGFARGWSSAGQAHATLTHEFGHAVERYIDNLGGTKFDSGEITKIKNNMIDAYFPKYGELSDYAMSLRNNGAKAKASRRREIFAEAFNQLRNRPPAEHARITKALGKLLEFMKARKGIGDLTPAESEALQKAIRAAAEQ